MLRAAALLAALALWPAAPHAEEWAPTGRAVSGDLFETDLSTLSRDGNVVHSWVRLTLAHPQKDALTGKTYVVSLDERFDDCEGRRARFGEALHRDKRGLVVSTTNGGGLWQALAPGTASEVVARVVCRATQPLQEKPFLASYTEDNWATLGPSADKKYVVSVNLDRIETIRKSVVTIYARSDYGSYEILDGFPIKAIVTEYGVDCDRGNVVMAGSDLYMSAHIRAEAVRTPPAKLAVVAIAPGTFLYNSYHQLCASASAQKPPPTTAAAEKAPEQAQVGTGTAWATSKGYLITASHVIRDANKIAIYCDGEFVGGAKIVADDPANDIAVLQLVTKTPRHLDILPLAEHPASLGRSIFTLGYPAPDILGQSVKMTAGEVSSTIGEFDDARVLQISAPVQPGNSGGPVIGWDGTVLGIVRSRVTNLDPDAPSGGETKLVAENVNYAVKSAYVRPLLEDLPDLGNYAPIKPAPGRDAMIEAARKAVFMVVVVKEAAPADAR